MKRLLMIGLLVALGLSFAHAQVAVIVNKQVGEKSLTNVAILDIYLLKTKSWDDGTKIVVLDLKNDEISDKFYGHFGKSKMDMKKSWLRTMLSGDAKAPEGFVTEDEVIQKVLTTPGAIGFVSTAKVKEADVKIVAKIE
jgi:ABC-type phosphate transport system substrate-binding protein